jgi:hypothetical protein
MGNGETPDGLTNAPEDDEVDFLDLAEGELTSGLAKLADISGRSAGRGFSPEDARNAREVLMSAAFVLAVPFEWGVRQLAVECVTLYGLVTGVDASWCDVEDLRVAPILAVRDRSADNSADDVLATLAADTSADDRLTARQLFASLVALQSTYEKFAQRVTTPEIDGNFEPVVVVLSLRYPAPIQVLASSVLSRARPLLHP